MSERLYPSSVTAEAVAAALAAPLCLKHAAWQPDTPAADTGGCADCTLRRMEAAEGIYDRHAWSVERVVLQRAERAEQKLNELRNAWLQLQHFAAEKKS